MASPNPPPEDLSALADDWGPPPPVHSGELRLLAHHLRQDLESLVLELEEGPFNTLAFESKSFLGEIRREFLRHHRRLVVSTRSEHLDAEALWAEVGELAAHLRAVMLSRASRLVHERWSPKELLNGLNTVIGRVPLLVDVPYEQESFEPHPGDSLARALKRRMLRFEHERSKKEGQSRLERSIHTQQLARQLVLGETVAGLEGLAVLMVLADGEMLAMARNLMDSVVQAYRVLIKRSEHADYPALVQRLRESVEDELAVIEASIDRFQADMCLRAERLVKSGFRAFKAELPVAGTMDAMLIRDPETLRSRERQIAEDLIERFEAVEKAVAGDYVRLGMMLEYQSFTSRVRVNTQDALQELTRQIRGRTYTQVRRILTVLDELLAKLSDEQAGEDAIDEQGLKARLQPLDQVLSEARRSLDQLEVQLTGEHAVAPLLEELRRATDLLTQHYQIPTHRVARAEWRLPPAPPEVEVELSRWVLAFLDSDVAPELLALTTETASELSAVEAVFADLERVLLFDPSHDAQLELLAPTMSSDLGEVMVGALLRSRGQLEELSEATEHLGDTLALRMDRVVRGKLTELGERLEGVKLSRVSGRPAIRVSLRERIRNQRIQLWSRATQKARQLRQKLLNRIGERRLGKLWRVLGLVPAKAPTWEPADVDLPKVCDALPVVYGRLFESQAPWAEELVQANTGLVGEAEQRLKRGAPGQLRVVGVVGVDGSGRVSLVTAIVRQERSRRVLRVAFSQPVTEAEVEAALADLTEEQLVVISGLSWTYAAKPGGFKPLEALLRIMLRDDGRNAWLFDMDEIAYRYIASRTVLGELVTLLLRIGPLSKEELARAVLGRHQLSGLRLCFEDGGQQESCDPTLSRQRGPLERRYFQQLHVASGGLLRAALGMWVASIERVDLEAGSVVVGLVPPAPTAALRTLSEADLLLLFQVARQGWMQSEDLAHLYRLDPISAQSALSRLVSMGLLKRRGRRIVETRRHLRGELAHIFSERGWL